MSFEAFALSAPLLRAVQAQGYSTPTPIQAEAIPLVMSGRDVLGCAQTGTGKTAAFALPILHRLCAKRQGPSRRRMVRTLVLSPTRELAAQIHDSFQTYGQHVDLRATVIYGGVSQHPQTRALKRGVDIMIATPGRLVDLMNQGYIDLSSVETFVLDEADRMLDMGFLPDLRQIIGCLPTERQTLLFSATMPGPIEELANTILREPATVRIAPVKETTDLIEQSVYYVPRKEKTALLIKYLGNAEVERALVFTRTKHGADRVAKQLNLAGLPTDAIHGDKSQSARQRILGDFRSSRLRVLVATDLAARGLDVQGISHVVNFDLPVEAETYVHRIGRTGRAGASGTAISFCDEDERGHLKAVERLIRQTLRVVGPRPAFAVEAEVPRQRPTGKPQGHGAWRRKPHGHARQNPRGGPPRGQGYKPRGKTARARPKGRG